MANDLTISSSSLKRVGMIVLGLLVVALVVIAIAAMADKKSDSGSDDGPAVSNVKKGQYQAVVLSNDRIYIGHLTDTTGDFWTLEDVHFIRETPGEKGQPAKREAAPIAEELVAPESSIQIAQADVVIVENLSKDSPVAAAIDRLDS